MIKLGMAHSMAKGTVPGRGGDGFGTGRVSPNCLVGQEEFPLLNIRDAKSSLEKLIGCFPPYLVVRVGIGKPIRFLVCM